MTKAKLPLDDELLRVLGGLGQSVELAARESMVLELYGRHAISAAKAADLLGMEPFDFVRFASSLGIPFFDMTEEELRSALEATRLVPTARPLPSRCVGNGAGNEVAPTGPWGAKGRRITSGMLKLDGDVLDMLAQQGDTDGQTARDIMIMGLYRRGAISRGKAAELLAIPLVDFLHRASCLDIPYFNVPLKEFEAELAAGRR